MVSGSGICGRTAVYGVWGYPVGHSRSPRMHNAVFAALGIDAAYVPFQVAPADIPQAVAGVRALGIRGVNVTVPLKELVPVHLDCVDPAAERLGVVNTIVNRDGVLHGYSTDGPGLIAALDALAWPVHGQTVYLAGAGGSARAVADALADAGNHLRIANRTKERAEALAAQVNARFPGQAIVVEWGGVCGPVDLVVNTTTLGMTPNESAMPALPPGLLETRPRVYDLVYAPEETLLMRAAQAAGCPVSNGLGMLVYQGALSFSLWLNQPLAELPIDVMTRAARGES